MAIILCPECKGKVSDKADVCPHCGFPISKTKNESENECFIDGTTYNLSDVLYHINNDTQHDYNEDKSGIKKEALYLLVTKYNLDLPDAVNCNQAKDLLASFNPLNLFLGLYFTSISFRGYGFL